MRALCLTLWVIGLTLWGVDLAQAGARFMAVALVCPVGVEGPACSRDNALDVAQQPATETDCLKVGAVLATHLGLAPGERHKITCERRKG